MFEPTLGDRIDIWFFGNMECRVDGTTTVEVHSRHKIDTVARVQMHKQQHAKSRYQRRQMKWRAKWWRMVFGPARQIVEQVKAGWHRGAWDD